MYKEVLPQKLTYKGSRVERALAKYKEEVNPPHYITGHVKACPDIKINGKPEEILFQHPYHCPEELYARAEQSQVGTAKKTLFMPDARNSREFSSVEVLNASWTDQVTAICDQVKKKSWLLVHRKSTQSCISFSSIMKEIFFAVIKMLSTVPICLLHCCSSSLRSTQVGSLKYLIRNSVEVMLLKIRSCLMVVAGLHSTLIFIIY